MRSAARTGESDPADLLIWARVARPAWRSWLLPKRVALSAWADEHYVLSAESSDAPGRWRTLPYQREILDAITDHETRTVTLMKSSRVGYTKILNCAVGYHIEHDPCGVLMVLPTVEDAEGHSKDEIAPMLRDVEVLEQLAGTPRTRDSSQTLLKKHFRGGAVLSIVGANSPRGFRRLTKRVVLFDEVDAYPLSSGGEGDPVELGKKRTTWAAEYLHVLGSSPKIKGISRIEASYEESDKRRYFVPCPHCGHFQTLRWGGKDADFGIKWPAGCPEEAFYLCERCHCAIEHGEKQGMVARGEWQAAAPFEGHAGFHIWAAYSPAPNAAWGQLAQEWIRSHTDPVRLQVFVNTVLGETWEEQYHSIDETGLLSRREAYPEREEARVVPRSAAVMTAGVDVQDDRIEVQVEGWGRGEENWKLEYHVLWGDPSGRAVWDDLWELLCRPRAMERGGVDYVRATCVDTLGHHTQAAYNFCRPRFRVPTPDGRRAYVFAIRGTGGPGKLWSAVPSRNNKGKLPLYTVHVDAAKEAIYARLQRVVEPGPGYIHFPSAGEFGEHYFEQLTAEKVVQRYDRGGFPKRAWELKSDGRRNEALDTAVYAMAGLEGLKAMGFDLERECDRVAAIVPQPGAPSPEPPSSPAPKRPRRRVSRSRFVER